MLRDYKKLEDEVENLPLKAPTSSHRSSDSDSQSWRAPLHAIQNPSSDHHQLPAKTKYERTPIKSKTPERQGHGHVYGSGSVAAVGRKRFGFSSVKECRDELAQSSKNGNGASGRSYSGQSTETTSLLSQTTPSKSVSKPPNPPFSSSRHHGYYAAALSRPFSLSNTPQSSLVNTLEVPHFHLKEDPSFWMDHNVQVILRVRPLNAVETSIHGYNRCVRQETAHSITWIGHPETRFTFDHVACETVDQEMLFRMAGLPMVENCLSGYNSCMFAYGQTGSGKTYTMLGDMEDVEFTPSSHRGMTPRIFEFLFARIRAEEESRSDEKLKYSCKCSFLEIYNEQITDLLDPLSTNLLLREDVKKGGVYVENLSEFEVQTVGDVLRLLIQGSSNRKVAATNMNRESSRSHCVFTCIIESKWERDSTTNLRFARLNLVDLAGSERQKTSGAEGERLKEAANINKSLSTLGHVIMLLVDIAHGKPRHVPYRDSRLTFLLQDSLGGNSKTMIIANISPSSCCASETLNTLKFAQRAKLIQNNAVVNEDSSGDIAMLQHQIMLLKEELLALKCQNLSRALAFEPSYTSLDQQNNDTENENEYIQAKAKDLLDTESKGSLLVSSKQLKSLELMLAGALRREQMAESSLKKLEAEIEQLNCLVRQREEDTRSTKMMLKFREDKIQRMESLMGDLKPVDAYLIEENNALSEEIQLLRAKVDRNPEVTRFAVENIRLLEQLRRYQDFYEEGERDILLQEVSDLRTQLISSLYNSSQQHDHGDMFQDDSNNSKENETIRSELTCTLNELAECQSKLYTCLETNAKLSREIDDLQAHLRNKETVMHDPSLISEAMKEMQVPCFGALAAGGKSRCKDKDSMSHTEEIMNLELELDILKIMLKEERIMRGKMEDIASSSTRDVQLADEAMLLMRKRWEDTNGDLKEARSVIEALESQQLLSISEIEDLKICNSHNLELLRQQELVIAALREQRDSLESTSSCLKHSEAEISPLQLQLKRMQASLDKAKRLNMWYQSDHASHRSNEEEMDKIRRQAEAETAEVIVCLQEELSVLQQHVQESDLREKEAENRLLIMESKLKELQEGSDIMSHENEALHKSLLEKNLEIKSLAEDWELLSSEIESSLVQGHEALRNASDQLASVSLNSRRGWISVQFGKMIRQISDKELIIGELNNYLEDANTRTNEMEHMLMSLKGAAMVMTESHRQECYEKETEMQKLRAELMAHLCAEEEEIYMSVKKGCESKNSMEAGVFSLQAAFTDFQRTCESRILAFDHKLLKIEGCAQEAKSWWRQTKESLEVQLVDAKASTAQDTVEATCLLARFREAQDTMKEADIMINGLMIANETLKIQVEDLRNTNIMLTSQRDSLINEVVGLQSGNKLINQTCRDLEEKLESDVSQNMGLVEELHKLVSDMQDTSNEAFTSLTLDLNCIKSQLHDTVVFMHSSLEDIWSQILMKDCALSVLHLCHMGVLLETVASLNAENGLLQYGVCESNAAIYDLREHNVKVKEELEMCRMLNGKLLAAFRSSFARILTKEGETRELSLKLDSFKEKLLILQHQEELMLESSNLMSSELSSLMMELGQSNSQMAESLADQEDFFAVEWYSKDYEVLIFASEMQILADNYADMQKGQTDFQAALGHLIREIVSLRITADLRQHLMFERETEAIFVQKRVDEAEDGEAKVLIKLQTSEAENMSLKEHLSMKENDLEKMQNGMFLLQSSSLELQNKLSMLEKENKSLQKDVMDLKSENFHIHKEIQDKDSEVESSVAFVDTLKSENCRLHESMKVMESRVAFLEKNLVVKKAELDDFQCLQSSTAEELCTKSKDLESYTMKVNALQEENLILRDEIQSVEQRNFEFLSSLGSRLAMCAASMETAEQKSCRIVRLLEEKVTIVLDLLSEDSSQNLDVVSRFLKELEFVDFIAKDLVSQNSSLQEELLRKDEVLSGLLFDLRLLQESAVNSKDQKDEIEELIVVLKSTESELATRSHELDEAVAFGQAHEAKVKKQGETVSALEMDLEKAKHSVNILSDENLQLRSQVEDIMAARSSLASELSEKKSRIDSLENELLEMGSTLGHVNDLVESLKSNLDEVNNEKDQFQKELLILEGKLETAQALAEENEAVAVEAQQIAECRRDYAQEKEEEVQLLERSVQELDSTIGVLENKVDVLKEDAERQRLQREELELELQSLKSQMLNVESADAGIKRHFDEKSKNLQAATRRIQVLEKDLKNKDTEIATCKAHILELTLHAEAQACEYKQKFKELEAMVEQVKSEEASNHERISSSNKLEKNANKGRGSASPFKAKGSGSPFKARGSGSPFKCIGLGLANQLKSEKDEEFNAERLRIEELEALAASRQKEIFMLNSRLAAAESMTHDVIRDLLGVKLDMSSYVTLLDKQEVKTITENAELDTVKSQDQEVNSLKKQLNEFIEERQGWLVEIDRKQAEVVAAQISLEKHRQQEQLLTSENEVLKIEIKKHRKRVTDLEMELNKVSSQQNLQQRIHHHAKIKEENNVLKVQNEDLCHRLRRAESFLTRTKEELAHYRACNGRSPHVHFDEEQRLKNKVKETEQEKLRLAETLLALCTSILRAAGVMKPASEVDLFAAEEALQMLRTRVISLERELEDLKIKNRITNEKVRLAELMPDCSPLSSRSGDNRQAPRRGSPSPFFSALDR